MRHDFDRIIIFLYISIFVPLLLLSVYRYDNEKVVPLGVISDYKLNDEYITIIDEVQQTSKSITIYGCSLKLGEDNNYINKQYVLIDNQNAIYGINTVVIDRPSATEYFNDGFNYDKTGLNGECSKRYLNSEMSYKLGIIIKEKDGNTCVVLSDTIVRSYVDD